MYIASSTADEVSFACGSVLVLLLLQLVNAIVIITAKGKNIFFIIYFVIINNEKTVGMFIIRGYFTRILRGEPLRVTI